jgi:hypothetical protein
MADVFRSSQLAGSQTDAEVLLEPPRVEILSKQIARRSGRQDNRYLIQFEG